MIPSFDVVPEIDLPAGDDCGYPTREEISEDGFGYFRGTWRIGHIRVSEARRAVDFERELVDALDAVALDGREYEVLAHAVEEFEPDDEFPMVLRGTPVEGILGRVDENSPLGGLEIGVAGLTYALSSVGFLTAASCRAHEGANSWSDCPVVLFGAHKWRAVELADLAARAECGIGQGREMLTVYAQSIRGLMSLADLLLASRASFRPSPNRRGRPQRTQRGMAEQGTLGL